MGRIAALLTCFNRKEKTRECLTSLFSIDSSIDVYLVDDGSTDGTSKMVKELFPQVNLINGTGNLFWTKGMHLAWSEALKHDYDYYLWLNDDVILYPYFLEELYQCHSEAGDMSVITGVIVDRNTKEVIYGGTDAINRLHKLDGNMHEVRDMNGNVVLVPKCVVEKIGIIDNHFLHAGGDTDYGYTAREHGIKVLTTRRAVAEGYCNNFDRLRKWNTNFVVRMKYLYSPMGCNPNVMFYFYKKHFGFFKAFAYYTYLHLLNVLPDCMMTRQH